MQLNYNLVQKQPLHIKFNITAIKCLPPLQQQQQPQLSRPRIRNCILKASAHKYTSACFPPDLPLSSLSICLSVYPTKYFHGHLSPAVALSPLLLTYLFPAIPTCRNCRFSARSSSSTHREKKCPNIIITVKFLR